MTDISLKTLIESGAHFGHQARRWNPKMEPFLYGEKEGIHIFDLTKTKEKLKEALEVIAKAAKEGKKIIIVGTKKQVRDKVKEIAEATESYYVNERWLGGTLTNFDQIKKSLAKLSDMKNKMQKGEYKTFTKKERLLKEREIQRLERFFSGIALIERKPDLAVIVDTRREKGAVHECRVVGVETIGIVDSNSDPMSVDYPIPMNDDAAKAIDYVLDMMKETILDARKVKPAKEKKAEKKVDGKKKKEKSTKEKK